MMSRLPTNTSNEEAFDFLFKIVVIGDCGIGKTSLVQRFKSGIFTERYTNTIGVDFAMKTVIIEGKQVKVSLLFKISRNVIKFFVFYLVSASNLGYWYAKPYSVLFDSQNCKGFCIFL